MKKCKYCSPLNVGERTDELEACDLCAEAKLMLVCGMLTTMWLGFIIPFCYLFDLYAQSLMR
jgi:hypothetical protein